MDSRRFLRIGRLLGDEAVTALSGCHVVVVGMGAVGSYALEVLARSGVGHLRIVDFDTVGITNINRQLLATDSTIGIKKVEVARRRILDINPDATVEPMDMFAHEETLETILDYPVDLVIDAIDSLAPKLALLEGVWKRNIPVISSMGAALRTDPTKITTGDLMDTYGCPLAKQVRTKLRRRGVGPGIKTVFSSEPVDFEYKEPHEEQHFDYNEQILDRGRVRKVLGSLPSITGMFGLRVGHEAIFQLLAQKQAHERSSS
ncbi:MAG TPA: tRNA threonylcarbamoyladenosine dehydratase [Sphaerochaeta sp.]|nr:MAG: tRNA threonylcarbamoyladenosine dehydratase [Spirochaetes bacterium GWC2_52_13]OHD62236.1 MAG: tRNA threonylcarbamoyladenosine dehydratase [Spirochaetes bacterium GWF2_52_7]HCG62589.1 tRNA threonylcarbamoyladenosine dehydratase [Sphaerochaeta sp.]HCJ94560.1 tRNA threonylcarbamoyladenosine dehydratase [Sphaerochaeta sp.]